MGNSWAQLTVLLLKACPRIVPGMARLDRKVSLLIFEVISTHLRQALQRDAGDISRLVPRWPDFVIGIEHLIEDIGECHQRRSGIDSLTRDFDPPALSPYPVLSFDKGDLVSGAGKESRGGKTTESCANNDDAGVHDAGYRPQARPTTNWTPATAPAT